jgi:cysteine synthase
MHKSPRDRLDLYMIANSLSNGWIRNLSNKSPRDRLDLYMIAISLSNGWIRNLSNTIATLSNHHSSKGGSHAL